MSIGKVRFPISIFPFFFGLLVLYFFLSNWLHYCCCCCWSHLLFKANGTIAVMFLCGRFANFCSWNCGHEGPTSDPAVIETRIKQVTPSSIYHVSTWSLFLILALPL